MRVTDEMRDGLVTYKGKHFSTNVELAKHIGMSAQNLGRLISGQLATTSDECGQRILNLLGLKEPQAYEPRPRHWVRIEYTGTAMQPVLGPGTLVGESAAVADIKDGDIVAIQFTEKKKRRKEVHLGYFYRESSDITLRTEDGFQCACTHSDVDWLMRITLPARTITIGD